MAEWLILAAIVCLIVRLHYLDKTVLQLQAPLRDLLYNEYPLFTPTDVGACAGDLETAETKLKRLYTEVFDDISFKERPLQPCGDLKSKMQECTQLEVKVETLRELRTLQVKWNADIRNGNRSLSEGQTAFDEWQSKHMIADVSRAFKMYDEWVQRLNAESAHTSTLSPRQSASGL